MQFPKKKLETF